VRLLSRGPLPAEEAADPSHRLRIEPILLEGALDVVVPILPRVFLRGSQFRTRSGASLMA